MRISRKAALTILTASLVCSYLGSPALAAPEPAKETIAYPNTPAAWSKAAIDDINAAYQETLENHPGTYDPHNPGFMHHLADAKEAGLALATKATDSMGYVAALQKFSTTIHDGHAGIAVNPPKELMPANRWPGFVTVWRGDGLYVYAAEAGGPQVGARAVSCDGVAMNDIINRNVFQFMGRGEEAGHWWVRARMAFVDLGNPFVRVPQHCTFSVDGKTVRKTLTWQAETEQAKQWFTQSYNGEALPVGVTAPRKNVIWVAMPTFEPDEKQRDAYNAMTEDVQQHRQHYLDADAIVIDLRYNQGGSSRWSEHFAEALWGKDRLERRAALMSPAEEVWWRASKDNTAYVTNWINTFTVQKQFDAAEQAKTTSAGMQAALDKGDKYYVEKDDPQAPLNSAADLPTDPPAMTKPVYVIVPGQCASACLDALDAFTRFSNTKLIGAPSSADSTYMEVRGKTLPSHMAAVLIPNKVFVNRGRANGQIYTPTITVTDIDWSTENFLKVVEKDLRKDGLNASISKSQ